MRITICGSIVFIDEMQAVQKQLERLRHEVKIPPAFIEGQDGALLSAPEIYAIRKAATDQDTWVWERKTKAMRLHFNKVVWSQAILVLNQRKNNIENYVGANTLLEMGLAFHLNKTIYLYNPIPELSYKEEILGMRPIIINGNLALIG